MGSDMKMNCLKTSRNQREQNGVSNQQNKLKKKTEGRAIKDDVLTGSFWSKLTNTDTYLQGKSLEKNKILVNDVL